MDVRAQTWPARRHPWTVARQAPLSTGSPGRKTGAGCHALLQGNLPDLGIKLISPALAGTFFTGVPSGDPNDKFHPVIKTVMSSKKQDERYKYEAADKTGTPPLVCPDFSWPDLFLSSSAQTCPDRSRLFVIICMFLLMTNVMRSTYHPSLLIPGSQHLHSQYFQAAHTSRLFLALVTRLQTACPNSPLYKGQDPFYLSKFSFSKHLRGTHSPVSVESITKQTCMILSVRDSGNGRSV